MDGIGETFEGGRLLIGGGLFRSKNARLFKGQLSGSKFARFGVEVAERAEVFLIVRSKSQASITAARASPGWFVPCRRGNADTKRCVVSGVV